MSCPTGRTAEQLKIIQLEKELEDYKKAYDILMDYFDCIPDEEKEEVSKQLDECNL